MMKRFRSREVFPVNALSSHRPKKFVGIVVSALVGLGTALMIPGVAYAVFTDIEEGILIDEIVRELPLPAVSLASTGQSLVVYQDARLDDTGNVFCDDSGATSSSPGAGEGCVFLGRIVAADGVTVSDPFLLSGNIPTDYYQVAPSVTWNDTHSEWLVLMSSYETGFRGVYAQRVSPTGELLGSQVKLPSESVSDVADRAALTDTNPVQVPVLPQAVWSEEDGVYVVVWTLEYGVSRKYGLIGYVMTQTLQSADGVDAAFFISDPTLQTVNNIVSLGYSPDDNHWLVAYAYSDDSDRLRGRAIKVVDSAPVASDEFVVRTQHPDETSVNLSGGVVWVSTLDSWLVSWAEARNVDIDGVAVTRREVYGVYVAGDLFAPGYTATGERFALTDFPSFFAEEFAGDPDGVTSIAGHVLAYDSESDVVYGAGHVRFGFGGRFLATYWQYDVAESAPSGATTLVSPTDGQSSRSRIYSGDGGVAVVYQNWPQGVYSDPAQVRFVSTTGENWTLLTRWFLVVVAT